MIEATDNNKFMLYSSTITEKPDANDGELILTGMASSNSKSLYGEVMSENALQQMCETAVGLPILYDHEGKMGSVAGVVKNAYLQDNDLYLDFSILPKFQSEIRELLDYGVLLGLSIGGMVSSFDMKNELVEDITLVEVSLTPVPANRDTHGTVMIKQNLVTSDCLYGVCNTLIKQNLKEDEIISTEEEIKLAKPQEDVPADGDTNEEQTKPEEETDEPLTSDKVKEMIDEALAEKEKTIIETVLAEVKNMLNNDEEEEEPVQQSVDTEPVEPTVNIELNSDEIVEKLSAKIFGELENRRNTQSTKVEQATHEAPAPEKSKFTSAEAAEMIIRKMDETDPLSRAINQSLKQ